MLDIEKNYKSFIKYINTYIQREGVDKLVEWLDTRTDAKIAPASTRYHLSCEGGFIRHSLNVFFNLIAIAENYKTLYGFEYSKETIALVALLHDISKVGFYKKIFKNVKNEETQKWEQVASYAVRDEDARLIYASQEENSIFILQNFIKLTYEEQLAIRYHMGATEGTDSFEQSRTMTAFKKCPLAFMLYMADMQAMCVDESNDGVANVRIPVEKAKEEKNDEQGTQLST